MSAQPPWLSGAAHRRWRVRALLVALLAVAALGVLAPTPATADNAAVAINTRDGASIFRFAFSVRRVTSDIVDESNAAAAVASCEACQTVAIAIQVVLVFSEPEVITPENFAIALNVDCTSCVTAALAYQFVIGQGFPLRLTPEGNRRIAEIRQEFQRLREAGLPLEELAARVDELTTQLREVLATELVPAGHAEEVGPPDEPTGEGTETEPESEPEPETTTTEEPSRTAPGDDTETTETEIDDSPTEPESEPETAPETESETTSARSEPAGASTTEGAGE